MIATDEKRCGRKVRWLKIVAEFRGTMVPCWRRKWSHVVEFAGGAIAKSTPLVIEYRGSLDRAFRERLRLERFGYTCNKLTLMLEPTPAKYEETRLRSTTKERT